MIHSLQRLVRSLELRCAEAGWLAAWWKFKELGTVPELPHHAREVLQLALVNAEIAASNLGICLESGPVKSRWGEPPEAAGAWRRVRLLRALLGEDWDLAEEILGEPERE